MIKIFGIVDLNCEAAFGSVQTSASEAGPLPVWNDDHSQCIVMAGNHQAEPVLHAYETYGESAFKDLQVPFAAAIWDPLKKCLLLINDRFGLQPLFYYQRGTRLIFGSEVKAILEDPDIERKINWKAWADMAACGWINGEDTYFEDIFAMPPATLLKWEHGEVSLKSYWSYESIQIERNRSEDDFIHRGAELIEQAILKHTQNLEEASCLLSGGRDSRCIAATLAQHKSIRLSTYTTLMDRSVVFEKTIAEEVAHQIGCKHTFIDLPENLFEKHCLRWLELSECMTDEGLWLMPLVESWGTDPFCFDGVGADTIMSTRFPYVLESMEDCPKDKEALRLFCLSRLKYFKQIDFLEDVFEPDTLALMKPYLARMLEDEISKPFYNTKNPYLHNSKLYYLNNRVRRELVFASKNLLELKAKVILPFFDHELVDFALSIPPSIRNGQVLYDKILKKLHPQLMQIPTSHTQGIRRSKYNFPNEMSRSEPSTYETSETVQYLIETLKRYETPGILKNPASLERSFGELTVKYRKKFAVKKYLLFSLQFAFWYHEFFSHKPSLILKA